VVVELAAIVTLQCTDRATKLYPDEEVCDGGERAGLQPMRKGPKKMGKIIQNHQIVFITRNTKYRGGLEILMNQVKSPAAGREIDKKENKPISIPYGKP
jgi:hypothetical protein